MEKKDEESDSEEDEPISAPALKKVAPPKVKQEGDYVSTDQYVTLPIHVLILITVKG